MMQNDKVQKWVNSLPVQNGGDDIHEINSAEDGHLVNYNKAGDDMTLGAEEFVILDNDKVEETQNQGHDEYIKITSSDVEDSTMPQPLGNRYGSGGPVHLMKQRFLLQQQDSFNSETSSYLTIDSLDQLLMERRGDPEKILENLGFVRKFVNKYHRIPERFLGAPSKANGITVEKFLDDNPWLKEYLEQKASLTKSYETVATKENRDELVNETSKVSAETGNLAGERMTAFHQVASTVAMISRFRNLVRRLNNRDAPEPDVSLVEPILRNSVRGTRYWSILSLDNCAFLEQMGYYDMQVDKLSKLKGNANKFCLAANIMKNKLSGGSGIKPVPQEPVPTGQLEVDLRTKQTEKLDKILRSRKVSGPEKANEKSEKATEKIEPPTPKDVCFSVPQRFLTSQSQLFGSVQQMTGESVSELVRKSTESNFSFSNISELNFPVAGEHEHSLTDVNANSLVELPVIEISSARDSASSNATTSDLFEYEWQRTSESSAATEDSSGSDIDDRLPCFRDFLDHGLNIPGLSFDELGPPFLRVPSDAGSNLSSHTLQDLENTDHASDHDTYTDALQMSQDSVSLKTDESGAIQFSCSEQPDSQLASADQDGFGMQSNENDISDDNLPPVVNFSSKIKGVLRRQGSSQSDSSGFADSDHVDMADPTSLNKVRSINRMAKLDAIFSQDSVSMEENSAFSSQSNYFQSQQSSLQPARDEVLCRDSPHRLRILTGDYRNEFWSTNHSVQTQTDWTSFVNSQEGCSPRTGELAFQELCSTLSLKEKFLSQPEIYTTRLYIDSLMPKTSIPLVERTEVMLIVDGNAGKVPVKDVQPHPVTLFSSVDIKVVNTGDGHQHLTPVLFSSGESSTVNISEQVSEQFCPPHKKRCMELDHDMMNNSDNVIPPLLSKRSRRLVKADAVGHSRNSCFDITNHQILHSLLKQSVFISPHSAANLLPPSHWSTFGHADISLKQHLVEEVKLLQHALQKYRLEMKVLQMQAKKLYTEETDCLLPEERNALIMMEELRDEVSKELDNLDVQLSQRMKRVISVSPDSLSTAVDLSCLSVVQQMTELLKEQLYHSNIINGMSAILPACHHLMSEAASDAKTSQYNLLLDKIASLEKKMEEQSRTVKAFLNGALNQIQDMMQHQVPGQALTTPASISEESV